MVTLAPPHHLVLVQPTGRQERDGKLRRAVRADRAKTGGERGADGVTRAARHPRVLLAPTLDWLPCYGIPASCSRPP